MQQSLAKLSLIANVEPATLFVLGMLVIGVVLLRRSRLLRRGASRTNLSESMHGEQAAKMRTPPAELTQWEVQMHETARELLGQLDSKIIILQHLIADATQAAERLEAASAHTSEATVPLAEVSYQDWQAPRPSEPGAELEWLTRRDESAMRVEAARAAISDERHQQILKLAHGGYSRAAISQQIGVPLGDVELILSLHRPPASNFAQIK